MSLSDRTIYIFTPEVFQVVGSPTITDDGIASGFSGSSYIKIPNVTKNVNNFEIRGRFTNGAKNETLLSVDGQGWDSFLRTWDGKLSLGFITLGDIKIGNISIGQTYDFSIQYSNSKLKFGIKAIKGQWEYAERENIIFKSWFLNFNNYYIGVLESHKPDLVFNGSIDLKQFSISVDGKEVFSGSKKIEIGEPVLDDSEHLPKAVTNILGIDDILLAIDPEIQLLRNDISDLIKELYVKTTDKFIRRWENDFSLPYDSSLTLQQRRQRVLNKLARKKTLTWENLKLLIRNNIDNPQFYIMNDSENYHFTIMVQTPNYEELIKALDETIPAYLTYDIVVTEYFKRCGTFVSGTNPL